MVFAVILHNIDIFFNIVIKNNTITIRRNKIHFVSPWVKSTSYLGWKPNKMIYYKLCCLREEMILDTTETIYESWHEKPQRFFCLVWSISLQSPITKNYQWHEISETNKSYLCIFLLLSCILNPFKTSLQRQHALDNYTQGV